MFFNAGGGYVVSGFAYNQWYAGDPRKGWNLQLGYEWISSKKIGVGFLYSVYGSNGRFEFSNKMKESINFHYLAPQFLVRLPLRSQKWTINLGASLGLLAATDRLSYVKWSENPDTQTDSHYSLGSNLTFGMEFSPIRKLGITAQLSGIDGSFTHYDKMQGKSEVSKVNYVTISLGLKYHF